MMDKIQIRHVDVTGPQGVPYFKVPGSNILILSLRFFVSRQYLKKWVDGFNLNLACGCNWFSRCALISGDLKLSCIKKSC